MSSISMKGQSLGLSSITLFGPAFWALINCFCFLPFDSLTPPLFLPRSDETYVIGFMVPNQRQLLALAGQYGIRGSREELCNSRAIEELVLKAITEAALTGDGRSKEGRRGPPSPPNNICSLFFHCSPAGAL